MPRGYPRFFYSKTKRGDFIVHLLFPKLICKIDGKLKLLEVFDKEASEDEINKIISLMQAWVDHKNYLK